MSSKGTANKDLIENFWREEIEFRRIRRESADWSFIEKQPPRIKATLEYYIETGDLYVASRIAGVTVGRMNELRKKAGIPNVA